MADARFPLPIDQRTRLALAGVGIAAQSLTVALGGVAEAMRSAFAATREYGRVLAAIFAAAEAECRRRGIRLAGSHRTARLRKKREKAVARWMETAP